MKKWKIDNSELALLMVHNLWTITYESPVSFERFHKNLWLWAISLHVLAPIHCLRVTIRLFLYM